MEGAVPGEVPGSVLFACTHNAIRSPMAEGILKYLAGHKVYVDSCGVRPLGMDPFAIAVMDEIGIDLSRHAPKGFDDLEDDFFDLVISLSPEAQHSAVELTRTMDVAIEFWHMPDPSLVEASREVRLDAYRSLRDDLMRRIRRRFAAVRPPGS
ncbi:arsenate reductase/protein-tyrosine-phosphatase family protein [Geminicoccus harenae]|uniref:arsenate reductase/protein-tyrosine-phosphatase family protein n=1 Tax=Geminicoccus harenae TaxID=2498453 RepID=UPI00168B46E5|nr:low molecular weight phosphatase family protein [Geminicoccus harenae]